MIKTLIILLLKGIILIILIINFTGCRKPEQHDVPIVSTLHFTEINGTNATCEAIIISKGEDDILNNKGIMYGTNQVILKSVNCHYLSSTYNSNNISITLKNLTPNKQYFAKAFASNLYDTGYGNMVTFHTVIPPIKFNSDLTYGTMTDNEGNTYKTIQIGNQTWMAENLRVTKFRNGDVIPQINDSIQWINTDNAGYCSYNNNSMYSSIYGLLYNFYAINDPRNIAPEGWHIPTIYEWQTLIEDYNNQTSTNLELNETSLAHWDMNTSDVTNEKGFTAIPNGFRNSTGEFLNIAYQASWWSTFIIDNTNTIALAVSCYFDHDYSPHYMKFSNGCAVRCIKD